MWKLYSASLIYCSKLKDADGVIHKNVTLTNEYPLCAWTPYPVGYINIHRRPFIADDYSMVTCTGCLADQTWPF